MPIEERTRIILERLIETLTKRKETYGKAVIGLALSRNEKNEQKVCFVQINFQKKTEMAADEKEFDYGNFVLVKKTVEIVEAIKILRLLFESQTLRLPDLPEIPLQANISEVIPFPSASRRGYTLGEWPMLYTYTYIGDSTKGTFPTQPLAKLGLPLFPNGTEATNSFLELRLPKDWYTLDNRIEIRIPDYRARITSLRLIGNKMTLEVEPNEIAQSDLRAKFYCKGEDNTYVSNDVAFENGKASFTTDEEPLLVEAHIFSISDGSSIDSRRFDYRNPSKDDGIVIENSEIQLLDMINKGENENVEFKKELDGKEFLESVVSFANSRGGTIFLGVDDNCQMKGFSEEVQAKIEDLIHANCDPSIAVQVRRQVMPGNVPITIVEVPEGPNKPYILNNRGIFVRRGSSDRQIRRIELEDLISRRSQQYSPLR